MPSVLRVVKADYNGDKRRFAVPDGAFETLNGKLSSSYKLDAFALKYLDDEGDLITISNDEDLALAWDLSGSLLKVFVQNSGILLW